MRSTLSHTELYWRNLEASSPTNGWIVSEISKSFFNDDKHGLWPQKVCQGGDAGTICCWRCPFERRGIVCSPHMGLNNEGSRLTSLVPPCRQCHRVQQHYKEKHARRKRLPIRAIHYYRTALFPKRQKKTLIHEIIKVRRRFPPKREIFLWPPRVDANFAHQSDSNGLIGPFRQSNPNRNRVQYTNHCSFCLRSIRLPLVFGHVDLNQPDLRDFSG